MNIELNLEPDYAIKLNYDTDSPSKNIIVFHTEVRYSGKSDFHNPKIIICHIEELFCFPVVYY
jgi:hypothetical protein